MALTSEYQYIGRSNAVPDQNSQHSYYLLLYAKTSGDLTTGRHTVTVKQRLASTSTNHFYGFPTLGSITIAGTAVDSWSWENVPGGASDPWVVDHANGNVVLTESGVSYRAYVDLHEGSLSIDVGYGSTKDINVAASWMFNSGNAGYLPQAYVTAAVSATVTLPMIAGASQPSVSAASVELGQAVTIYTNRVPGSGLTHTLTYQFVGASGTIAKGVADSCNWTPAVSLANQIPSAVSGTAIITCTTYAGSTAIGSKQVTVTLTVPASVKPTVSAFWVDASGAYDLLGCLVQNVSKLTVDVDATGAYGSSVNNPSLTMNGKSYGGGVITDSGSLSLVVSVTDSRGRTGTTTYPITVVAYTVPSLSLSASRCTSDGTADDTGDHAKITVTGYVTQVNDSNSGDLTLTYGTATEKASLGVGDVAYQTIVPADVNATMTITAVLADKLVAASRTMVLSTGYATLDLLAGGKGISFGKAATREGFDCAMPAYFTEGINGWTESGEYPGCFFRIASGVTEWINPPMVLGVEYRTVKRWQGSPVYTMAVDFGAMPNNSIKQVEFTIASIERVLSGTASTSQGDALPYTTDYSNYRLACGRGSKGIAITITTNNDKSAYTAIAVVEYVKTTD